MSEDRDAGADIFRRGMLLRMVAEAVAAADEEHGDGADFRYRHAVVTGTAGEAAAGAGDGG
jgi:hypothetical protein